MAQATQPVSSHRETVLVSSPAEDVSKWRKYAATYYKRSLVSATPETRRNNRETYQQYRELLEAAGFRLEEKESLIIHEPNVKQP